MDTSLNRIITELKLNLIDTKPTLSEVLSTLETKSVLTF